MNKKLKIILIVIGIFVGLFVTIVAYELVGSGGGGEIKKPAVYLYPEEDSQIQVKVNINGKMIVDIPAYNDGWDVFVTKDSIIENQYDYLFYEAELNTLKLPKEGWVVKYENLDKWFSTNLIQLGLNEKEIFQFKEYWMSELPEANYYEIKILSEEFLNENMDLIIIPEPETEIRLNFHFKTLKENKEIQNPKILTPQRKGFTVVEWGGILG